jgi:glycosyltransferase involved in cell wall biosynthesis
VVIPVYRDVSLTQACVEAVLERSGPALRSVILVNDRSPERGMARALRAFRSSRVVLLENEANLGFVRSANRGLAVRGGDAVLLNSDAIVTRHWLSELLEVLHASDRIACVSPLSNAATINSIPEFCQDTTAVPTAEAPRWSRMDGLPRATEAPVAVGFCILFKDAILRTIGLLDPAFGRGYEEENDWAMRARRAGWIAVRANRAFVYHAGATSFGGERTELQEANAKRLLARHPHYPAYVRSFCATAGAHAPAIAARRRHGDPLAVALDLRHVSGKLVNGTGVYALELARHLARDARLSVSALATEETVAARLSADGVPATAGEPDADVLHRPSQVFAPEHLPLLLRAPAHLVLTYQDLIALRSPAVAGDMDAHARYRRLSFAAVRSAQAVIAISEHNRAEILDAFGLPEERVRVIHHGVDLERFARRDARTNRSLLDALAVNGPFLLYVGTDFPHKNLRNLVAGFVRLRARWKGTSPPELILAGTSCGMPGALYSRAAGVWPEGVRYLGSLPDRTIRALYQEALAFAYLSTYEGFGLPVLEAMAAGAPVVCSRATAIPEVAGDAAISVADLDDEAVAAALELVATDGPLRARLVEAGRARARRFTWAETARKTADLYLEVAEHPPPASLREREWLAEFAV